MEENHTTQYPMRKTKSYIDGIKSWLRKNQMSHLLDVSQIINISIWTKQSAMPWNSSTKLLVFRKKTTIALLHVFQQANNIEMYCYANIISNI
mmetsp:Transcript_3209/g.5708  ORF Transcript_3209/g.5708 Transcript_3209/m.5708 type:complete len:93 (-) Transcript_3209:1464-1742(-)